MKKALFAGFCALALSATGALAQASQESNNPTAKPGMMKNDGMKNGTKNDGMKNSGTTGMSNQGTGKDANVPGSTNAGGTSQASPNTVKPGSSDKGH